MKNLFTLALVALITACSHPIEIEGEGDVMSASGDRNCSLEDFQTAQDNCTKNYAIGAYEETYTPMPRDGWKFDRWATYCTTATAPNYECSFDVDAATVRAVWGKTMPPLQAVFTVDNGLPISNTVTVEGREWAQVNIFTGITWNEVDAACSGEVCTGKLNGYDVTGWVWASVDDVNHLFNSYLAEEGALGPGPDRLSTFDPTTWASEFYADGWTPTETSSSHNQVFGLLSTSHSTDYAYEARIHDYFNNDPFNGSSDEAATTYVQQKHERENYMGVWMYRAQAITDTVSVAGRVWAQPDLFVDLSWNQIEVQCPSGICSGSAVLNGYHMRGWKLASVDDVNYLFNNYIGNDVMGPGPDSAYASNWDSWGSLMFDDGFRLTLHEGSNGMAIEGLTADEVAGDPDRVHVGVFVDYSSNEGSDSARTYGSHGKDDAYGFTGAWFYRAVDLGVDAVRVGANEWAQPDLLTNLSWHDVAEACPDSVCNGTLNGFDVTGWTWASVSQVNGLFNAYGVEPPLVEAGELFSLARSTWAPLFFTSGFRPLYEGGSETGYVREIHGLTSSSSIFDPVGAAYVSLLRTQPEEEGGGPGPGSDTVGSGEGGKWDKGPGLGVWLYRSAD